ncbi:DUF6262 family protein [Nonomuraea sp. M3C6]|uniref:DUF6262 family protein n=1 Tax=Nonomuraea marmarensis TaxID=3351344 RepID=A0ABW7AUV6_9ACTN
MRTLIKRGEPITFQAVQGEAGVSHSFFYTHPTLRQRIETSDGRTRPHPHPLPIPLMRTTSSSHSPRRSRG